MYRCHFCNLNIERYDIENHFDKFHKFRSPSPEHVCRFSEDEVFNSKNDLLKHNKYVHDYDEESELESPSTPVNPHSNLDHFDLKKLNQEFNS